MVAIAHEQLGSRSVTLQNGEIVGKRSFWVYDATLPQDALVASGLPVLGDPFPGFPALFAVNRPVTNLLENQNDVWEVEWEYRNNEDGSPIPPGEVGYVRIDTGIERKIVDQWRVPFDTESPGMAYIGFDYAPVAGIVPAYSAVDIGGYPNAINQTPLSWLRLQQEVILTEIRLPPIPYHTYREAASRRNSTMFYGGSMGFILYHGAETSRIGFNKYEVKHKFTWDEYAHLQQVPKRDQMDKVIPLLIEASGLRVPKFVFWRQPFPFFYDFTTLSEFF